jgi:tRNA(adenine34) deaminase
VIFGCDDPRSDAAGRTMNLLQHRALNHKCDITSGVLQIECADLLQSFLREGRMDATSADDNGAEA